MNPVQWINSLLTGIFDLLLKPLAGLPPVLALTIFSTAFGAVMALLFERLSGREAQVTLRKRLQGGLLAVRLFPQSPVVLLKVQGTLLADSLRFLRHSLKPLAILLVPVLLALAQLHGRYGLRPLQEGETAVVTVRLRGAARPEALATAALTASEGVRVDSAAVRIPARKEVSWRIAAPAAGRHSITVAVDGAELSKEVVSGLPETLLSPVRTGDLLLLARYPGEPPLPPGSAVESIRVSYPPADLRIGGLAINWLALFCLLSLGSGLLVRSVFAPEI